jgi:DNA-binding CsgD family transcriptional regulator
MGAAAPGVELQARSDVAPAAPVRSGRELVELVETLYLRLFVISLAGLQFVCGLAVVAALVRTEHANYWRTAVLSGGLALLAACALRMRVLAYHAIRRRPVLSLAGPLLVFTALAIDGVSHSPLSYPAAVSIAVPAFVCGRRWALGAALLISAGAITVAVLRSGWDALNSTGQGTAGYVVWALVLAGLAERFAQLTIRMPHLGPVPAERDPPVKVANLAANEARTGATQTRDVERDPAQAQDRLGLTARQMEVVVLLADGLQAGEIAARLGVATSSVYRHVKRAKERTGARSRSDLVALVVRAGIVPGRNEPLTRSHH